MSGTGVWARLRAAGLALGGALCLWGGAAWAGPGEGLYDLTVPSLEGQPVPLSQYRGQVAMVVNTASRCGFTGQYADLEALYQELRGRGFVVLGFPCDEFGGQEPGSAEEIRAFCTERYQVTFPLFAKVRVKRGPEQAEVYRFLTAQHKPPSWNFTKYLVDRQGRVRHRYGSMTSPGSRSLRKALEELLKEPAPGAP